MSSFILIDGKNNLFRHQHVHNFLATQKGFPTGAIFGCLSSMLRLHKRLPDAAIVWVWDGRGETWRHKFMQNLPQLDAKQFPEPTMIEEEQEEELSNDLAVMGQQFLAQSMEQFKITDSDVPFYRKTKKVKKRGYKAQRHRPELDKEKDKELTAREKALLQIPVLRLILEGCGIRNYEIEGLECDDLLAMIVKKIIKLDDEAEIIIDSGDRDYYQLLSRKQVSILAKKDGHSVRLYAKHIEREYGVRVKNWAKFRALTGDSSDNIPHLAKVGSVRAKQMLAAGIDPSSVIYPVIDDKYKKYFPHGVASMWPALHGNYKLCRLVDNPDDVMLSDPVRDKLAPMFDHFDDVKRFYRSSKGKTPEAFRRVSFLLGQYEMASILARRGELWDIP